MKRLRLFIAENRSDAVEQTFLRLPVRVGRHPRNECQILDPQISRFHAQIEWRSGFLVVRDVDSQNGTVFFEGASQRLLRGNEARSRDGELSFAIGSTRIRARVEEHDLEECVPDAFAPTARRAADALLDACGPQLFPIQTTGAELETLRTVIDSFFDGLLRIRTSLYGDECVSSPALAGPRRSATTSALLKWMQATSVALRLTEHASERWGVREDALLSDASAAVNRVLQALAPERLEQGADSGKAPEESSGAAWRRYREVHRRLVRDQAREPSLLLGRAIAAAARARSLSGDPPVSGYRARNRAGLAVTGSESSDLPPSSGPRN